MAQLEFLKLLPGTWAGQRKSPDMVEKVMAVWEPLLDGSFLRESWFTSGGRETLDLSALAFFRVTGNSLMEFFVVYKGGRMAMGKSEMRDGEWRLTHEWFGGSPEVAEIRIRFGGDDTYQQEVHSMGKEGTPSLKNRSILVRQRDPEESEGPKHGQSK
jgi:hypothetical protein